MNNDVDNIVGKIITVTLDTSLYPEEASVVDVVKEDVIMAKYSIQKPGCISFQYVIHEGSAKSFTPPGFRDSAIVVASNEYFWSESREFKAVIDCGGERLVNDIRKLPIQDEKRCLPGQAVKVGGQGQYGDLKVPYIIFAVEPAIYYFNDVILDTLIDAYQSALNIAKLLKLETVAFSLIGANIQSEQMRKVAIGVGVRTIYNFAGYSELKEIHHFAFDASEAAELRNVCHDIFIDSRRGLPTPVGLSSSHAKEITSDQSKRPRLVQQTQIEQYSNIEPSIVSQDTISKLSKGDGRSTLDDSSDSCNRSKVSKSNMMTRITSVPYQRFHETNVVESFLIRSQKHVFYYTIHEGSIESFSSVKRLKSGIVVASNEKCSSSKGVLGAVTRCGGETLRKNVKNLPTYGADNKRCLPGNAVMVGNGQYGSIMAPYIVFAVAPNPQSQQSDKKNYKNLLMEVYQNALKLAKEAKLEAVAFSLIGAGYRSGRDNIRAIRTGVCAIATFEGYPELKEIHHYGYQTLEATELTKACRMWCSEDVNDIDECEI
jgi:O-acetyl-ADP-ribose deacetylase (regulator of RNase III)